MQRFLPFLIMLISPLLMAQDGDHYLSGRSMGMGVSGVVARDAYAACGHLAGVTVLQRPALTFAFHNLFGVKGLNRMAVACSLPYRQGVFALEAFRFGDRFFNEHKVSLGYAHRIRFVSLGLRISYLQFRADLQRTKALPGMEFGGLAEFGKKMVVGGSLSYTGPAGLIKQPPAGTPFYLRAGIAWKPLEGLLLMGDLAGRTDQPPRIGIGMEYDLRQRLWLRMGFSLQPEVFHCGLGLPIGRFAIDQAFSVHPLLGLSSQFSMVYTFPES